MIEYKKVPVRSISLELSDRSVLSPTEKTIARHYNGMLIVHGKVVKSVVIDGERIYPTGRFWSSLYSTFGLNTAFFRYFDPDEIFKRVAERSVDQIRVCVEHDKATGNKLLLAMSGLNKPVILYDDWLELLNKYNVQENSVHYHHGIVTSTHMPKIPGDFNINNDKFSRRFTVYTPVDGYGSPNIYLSLLRFVCTNGAVGFANAFKTALALGTGQESINYTLNRALEAFSNDEGYSMLQDRFDAASKSWASIREQQELYHIIIGLQNDTKMHETISQFTKVSQKDLNIGVGNAIIGAYEKMTGKPFEMFTNSMSSQKKMRTLPVGCRVYDLLNFATELATHHVSESNTRKLQAWVGSCLSSDYDLEDSANVFDDFKSLFIQPVMKEVV